MTVARALIADDHPLVRAGLALALRLAMPGSSVDQVGSIAEAEQLIAQHRVYGIVFLDFVLPGAHGFSGLVRLRAALGEATPIVMISAYTRPEIIGAAKSLGAVAFLSKSRSIDDFSRDVRRVLAGETLFPPYAEDRDDIDALRARMAHLSDAQMRVLTAMADGRLNKQIAGELDVSEATIKAHLTAIFRKLGVTNRTQAILTMQPLFGTMAGGQEMIR